MFRICFSFSCYFRVNGYGYERYEGRKWYVNWYVWLVVHFINVAEEIYIEIFPCHLSNGYNSQLIIIKKRYHFVANDGFFTCKYQQLKISNFDFFSSYSYIIPNLHSISPELRYIVKSWQKKKSGLFASQRNKEMFYLNFQSIFISYEY